MQRVLRWLDLVTSFCQYHLRTLFRRFVWTAHDGFSLVATALASQCLSAERAPTFSTCSFARSAVPPLRRLNHTIRTGSGTVSHPPRRVLRRDCRMSGGNAARKVAVAAREQSDMPRGSTLHLSGESVRQTLLWTVPPSLRAATPALRRPRRQAARASGRSGSAPPRGRPSGTS